MKIGVATIANDTRQAGEEASVASIWPVAMRCDAMGLPSAAAQCKCKQWVISGGGVWAGWRKSDGATARLIAAPAFSREWLGYCQGVKVAVSGPCIDQVRLASVRGNEKHGSDNSALAGIVRRKGQSFDDNLHGCEGGGGWIADGQVSQSQTWHQVSVLQSMHIGWLCRDCLLKRKNGLLTAEKEVWCKSSCVKCTKVGGYEMSNKTNRSGEK